MLESLIVLTVLNCIFIFSSTVTTCALWWQLQDHRCCPRNTVTRQKSNSKRSKSYTVKKSGKSNFDGNIKVVSKSSLNKSRKHRSKCQKKRSEKDLEYQKRSKQKISFPDGQEARKFDEKAKMSETSQTINDTKSTVVMEFSTIQKIVQIVDNDPDINSVRTPFKEIVIQKDTADRKHDNVEANIATTDS